jgi:hypothetical protein
MHAVLQVLISFPTGRALPKKFFGSRHCLIVFVVGDFNDEFIDICGVVIHWVK